MARVFPKPYASFTKICIWMRILGCAVNSGVFGMETGRQ